MQLSKHTLKNIEAKPGLEIPDEKLLALPEKVLQFGTGVLLRGLPDYFIDKANKQGIFNGRVVIVKSTDGSNDEFAQQDGLYTVSVRGLADGQEIKEDIINASVSRVLTAKSDWPTILECAHNADMNIVLSNTTEVGIQLVEENVLEGVPSSFPGKLLAFLYERYNAFNGAADSGMVIVPTELITDNGDKLKGIMLQLANFNKLDSAFINWLTSSNTFCNSLVDRIVPGKPSSADLEELETSLGYTDALLTMSEPFRLWAIEGNEKVKEVLSFYKIDDAVKIEPDITLYKELKLRILNGTHTFNCGTAFLSGFNLTREAVGDEHYGTFTRKLMKQISDAIPYKIDENVKAAFVKNTFERFCNPFINHQWQSITTQYTSKMNMRNVPLLLRHYELNSSVPQYMGTGFAAYLLYMKSVKDSDKYFGDRNGERYEIKDDAAAYFYELWQNNDARAVAEQVLKNESLWSTDLTQLPGFANFVKTQLQNIIANGALQTVAALELVK
ncbi:tagaturonate reductase [Flavobacterium zepuense]|uniref:Tagaturonate reductase n=1 Tax=Flavobacterium zepuense TaxID=2593302 RepID=A0A552V062_9FLAO|nr:tagaturonate reductase [Flavobacterium zepuense]TRW23863.1 tagaturonate reductase [Flavobacterium zepuense]